MATIVWIFWAGTGSLVYFINGIVWRDNATNWAPVWCDIGEHHYSSLMSSPQRPLAVTRFLHVQPIGICLASALINHRLWRLTKMSVVRTTPLDVGLASYLFSIPYLLWGWSCCRNGEGLSSTSQSGSVSLLSSWRHVSILLRRLHCNAKLSYRLVYTRSSF